MTTLEDELGAIGKILRIYVLDGHEPKATDDFRGWMRFMTSRARIVKQTDCGEYLVSTVFIGISYQPVPAMFETGVIGPDGITDGTAYETWEEAEKGHEVFVARYAPRH